jgi:virginiamycin B lyase
MRYLAVALVSSLLAAERSRRAAPVYFDVVSGSRPTTWRLRRAQRAVYYTAQRTGRLGILDPCDPARSRKVDLGTGSGSAWRDRRADGGAWVTDGGQNAIVRVDPATKAVRKWPLRKAADTRTSTR